jgi:tRNA(His) guanylyltransferase
MKNDSLGDRMKGYEAVTRTILPRRTYTLIRLDGKAFHTYTRGLERPFDKGLVEDMQQTTIAICSQISGTVCAYTQSDEISLLLTDFNTVDTQAWFANNIQKITSISASAATAAFNTQRINRMLRENPELKGIHLAAQFDSRVFTIPDPIEVENYFIWRQQDATRNAIQMVAQSMYSHKELHGKRWADLNELIFQKGQNFNDYDSRLKRGSFIIKAYKTMEMLDRKTKEMRPVERSFWEVMDETPMFTSPEGRDILAWNIPKYEQFKQRPSA